MYIENVHRNIDLNKAETIYQSIESSVNRKLIRKYFHDHFWGFFYRKRCQKFSGSG